MTVPAEWFGRGSDGAGWMEEWLAVMCADCVHGTTEDGLAGMGCILPANAYASPYDDIIEWSTDADRIPHALKGLLCMQHEARPAPERRPRPEVPGQLRLAGDADA